jgi:nucleotide-binding universal stress UspA family protein
MYSKILVAVDGSPNAERALDHAAALARAMSAALRIVHVVDLGLVGYGPELGINVDALIEARYAFAEKVLAAARARVEESRLAVETLQLDPRDPAMHVAATIADAASAWPADLVVLGTQGRRGMERWLLGSGAEGVARRSTVPVLLVPAA